ncbi:TPA: tRNA pseudouridine(55) synthase TruB [Acinetobacter baumannii]|uniref:tRNA pseudouridine synthase B n=4 Tax=Acinetobacter baumannii TaxID=470 RepID=A0A333BWG6_ACIBA|nr:MULTISPECIES: tRNA pseudouridine(55) synthase TruB [Acinetobacter]AHX29464.1 pseudouridine synthase [Acinetobacter baumannii AC12]AHX65460.1 pseudouridine synthase [Acinetobacter baumannii AC30]AHJ94781.1 tRNA pseudouridine synthase B [Acinetobacter baumannii PKAB07]AHJ94955.1 tRNA pseudouridine synthase B [Acinetobacter baumannii PKAB07]AIA52197.1 pseudouridine synthase [Acinetobacter baumannii]
MTTKNQKISRRHISGVFLLNKPLGQSSNAALQKVRWLYRAQKAGHTGALDPLATGLLPICLGEATKFSHYLLDSTKRYQTTVRLGQTTTTGDVEGDILQERPIPVLSKELIEQTLEKFRGDIQQVPPMYSALKKEGKPLYELARKGIEIERETRPVTIYALELIEFTENSITLDVTCSKGTYIRVLGEDIGEVLGCGGHLTMLHRIQTGHFELIPSYTIEYLESLMEEQREALLLPVYAPIDHFLKIQVPEGREKYFCNGLESNIDHSAEAEVLVFSGERCLGLAEITDKKRLVPKRILNL